MNARCRNKPACGGQGALAALGMTEPGPFGHFRTRPEITHAGELPGWQPKVRSARGRTGRSPVSTTKSARRPG